MQVKYDGMHFDNLKYHINLLNTFIEVFRCANAAETLLEQKVEVGFKDFKTVQMMQKI